MLRERGLRKKVAEALTESDGRTKRGKPPATLARTVENLRAAASELEERVAGSRRSGAARKAAQTRKGKAAKRSASTKNGAKTRSETGA